MRRWPMLEDRPQHVVCGAGLALRELEERALPEELPRIASGDQALFMAMLSSQEGPMKNRGVSQQAIEEAIASMLMEQCAYICAEMYVEPAT